MPRYRPLLVAFALIVALVVVSRDGVIFAIGADTSASRDADAGVDADVVARDGRVLDDLRALRASLASARDAVRALERAVGAAEETLERIDAEATASTRLRSSDDVESCTRDARRVPASSSSSSSSSVPAASSSAAAAFSNGVDFADEVRRVAEAHVRSLTSSARLSATSEIKAFSDAFERLSITRDVFDVTATHLLPFKSPRTKTPRYYATGNARGRVAVYDVTYGEAACETATTSNARVMSLTAYMVSTNTSVLVSGHEDGTVAFTTVEIAVHSNDGLDAMDFPTKISAACSAVSSITAREADVRHKNKLRDIGRTSSSKAVDTTLANGAIETLGMYRIMGKRYVAAADTHGRVIVFAPAFSTFTNIHGVFYTGSRVLAFRPYSKAIVALTERGVVHADIVAFTTKSYSCDNLMYIDISRAMFDPRMNSKLIGIDHEGRLFTGYVSMEGPKTGCAVHRPGDAHEHRADSSAMATIKGYILVAMNGGVEVLNTTLTRTPQVVIRASVGEQLAKSGVEPTSDGDYSPILTTDGERHVVIAHPKDGVVLVYESTMFTLPPPRLIGDSVWFQPLALMFAIGVGIWSYKKSREPKAVEERQARTTEDALRKLGYGLDKRDTRGMFGEHASSRPAYQEWTVERLRKEIDAAKRNGDL